MFCKSGPSFPVVLTTAFLYHPKNTIVINNFSKLTCTKFYCLNKLAAKSISLAKYHQKKRKKLRRVKYIALSACLPSGLNKDGKIKFQHYYNHL